MSKGHQAPKELLKAQKWANLLDTAIKLPFIPFRIGLDSLVGLIPGAGDALMFLAGLRIVSLARALGAPSGVIKAMVRNAVLDFGLGFIPIVGDIADFFYKSNQKNVRLLERWWISNNKAEVDAVTREKLQQWENQLAD